ncbi:MAG: tRNA (N(6)-L-threonylcarbamoyladenosine(37)-C(2))-methylthiotransferase MtaB [Clostridia bacterium]|nr:tRNA (N(6)-L-threonylcarbamoyladenosine(37)-C(2))-methylthiotransferase MtaB [Clostridia bacterium]
MNKKYKAAFITLGCRVNQYETRAVKEAFEKLGFETGDFSEKCDVYVINTCTVTSESDRKSMQMIRRARNTGGKDAVVIAMGCMVQINPEKSAKIGEIDLAVGNKDKISCAQKALDILKSKKREKTVEVSDISGKRDIDSAKITGSDLTKAFLKICDGCNNSCAYCIIPKARGSVCSKSVPEVKSEVETLCDNGYKEVVLTGIETAAYGKDINSDLVTLVESVNSCEKLARIRLGSLEPTFINEKSIARLQKCEKFMPHYHLSLQSGCDAVLNAMRRKYNTKMFLDVVRTLKDNIRDVTLTTDIIVGFPGETEEMFRETVDFVKKCGFLYVHIFPYSDRAGTEASKMKNKIDAQTKRKRALALKKAMLETRKSVISGFLGTEREVLVEKTEGKYAFGHTDNFIETKFENTGKKVKKNDIVKVKLKGFPESAEYAEAEICEV